MKKILFALLSLIMALSLVSCGGGGNTNPPEDNKPDDNEPLEMVSDYIAIVRPDDADIDMSPIVNAFYEANGKMITVLSDTNTALKGEIVFGDADRDVTREAKAAYAARVAAESGDIDEYGGYIIYKDAIGNIAVYWTDSYSKSMALDMMKTQYLDVETLCVFYPGEVYADVYNVDDYIYEATWGKLEAQAPAEVVAALKLLSKMFDGSAIVDWMANLWEPYVCACGNCAANGEEIACYGGGFYYANSARDYDGFLPDLESTYYIVNWMIRNGAATGKITDYLPEHIQERLLAFVEACHSSSDGYFYHPQWGTNIATDRKGRDYSWGSSLLSDLKSVKNRSASVTLTKNNVGLTRPLGVNTEAVISLVAPVDAFDEALENEVAFLEWLKDTTNGDKMFENSAGAHVINAVQDRIIEYGYLEVTLDYLDAQQEKLFKEQKAAYDADPANNPEPTGLWQRNVDYNAVWGLLKFATFYSNGNREIKYAEYAMKTCVGCIMIDADEGGGYHMNDVYNQWSSASNLINNAKTHNPAILPTLYAIASANVTEMMQKTVAKLAKFIQADGSYGYNQGTSAPSVYGTQVSLGLPEGDVNATNLATSMYRSVFTVLGLDVIPLCDYRDGERFVNTISSLGSAEKLPVLDPDPIDFDVNDSGYFTSLSLGTVGIVTDPKNSDNLVLEYTTQPGANDGLYFNTNGPMDGTCFIFEADIYVESVSTFYFMQVNFGGVYMIDMTCSNGKLQLRDNPTTSHSSDAKDLNFNVNLGEWFHIRVEYYVDPVNPTIKVYKDGTLTKTSHNYFGCKDTNPSPDTRMDTVRFWAMRASDAVLYFDNVKATRAYKTLDE